MKPIPYRERDAGAGASTSPRYTRREWIGLAALASAGLSQTRQRPNILYIMADDHAAHAISAYGSTINRTPNIDRIAETGARLTNCFCTNSICTPSRASILTGQYSHKNGVYTLADKLDPKKNTVAQDLQRGGYQTAIVGKWHLVTDPTGFDYWKILPGQGAYQDHDPKYATLIRQLKIELEKKQKEVDDQPVK